MLIEPIDLNLFYLMPDRDSSKKKGKKRKWGSESDSKNQSSETSKSEKTEFSLRDLSLMSTMELSSKIFTFDKSLATKDMTKMAEEGKQIELIVKGLPSMRGLDVEFVPKFKFIQFKKSEIKNNNGSDKVMLCFNDISQKILYDTTKAEGEFLSLINSTVSHEMRNPLNSIINQGKIILEVLKQFKSILD